MLLFYHTQIRIDRTQFGYDILGHMSILQFKYSNLSLIQRTLIAWAAIIGLVIFAGGLIFNSVQQLWFTAPVPPPPSPVVPVYQEPSIDTIPSMHLFGASLSDKDLPLVSIGLQVQGIFFDSASGKSRALIGMAGQAPQMYNVGDILPGNVKIFKITRDSVIVIYNNQLSKLLFTLQGIDFNTPNTHQGLFGS